jgi:hypothetical protein
MRTFVLNRLRDVAGVSGTGIIAEGVVFQSGKTVVHWLTKTPSINIYDNVEDVFRIHGHEGATAIEFLS